MPKVIILSHSRGIYGAKLEGFPSTMNVDIEIRDEDLSLNTEDDELIKTIDNKKWLVDYQKITSRLDCDTDMQLQLILHWDKIIRYCAPMADHILWTILPAHIKLRVLEKSAQIVKSDICEVTDVLKDLKRRWVHSVSSKLWEGLTDVSIQYDGVRHSITDVSFEMTGNGREFLIPNPKLHILPEKTSALEPSTLVDPTDPLLTFEHQDDKNHNSESQIDTSTMTYADFQLLQDNADVQTEKHSANQDPEPVKKDVSKLMKEAVQKYTKKQRGGKKDGSN